MSVSDFITGFGTGWQLMDGFLEWREKRQTEQDDANELADRQQTGEEQAWRRAQDAFNPSSSAGTSDMPHEGNIADPTHNIQQRSARQSLATGQPERPPDPMTDDNAADIMDIRLRGLQTTGDGAAANFNIDDVQNLGAIPAPPSQNPAVARAQATARERQAATRTSGSNQSAIPAGYEGLRGDIRNASDVRSAFMGRIQRDISNPYALAVIDAHAAAESSFSPNNLSRTWADPSESGQPGTSGGILSWRADRLRNLQNFAGDRINDPTAHAEFLLQEDPRLIQRLQGARSIDEAHRAFSDSWRFAGFNRRDGGEYQARLRAAQSLVPQYRGTQQSAIPASR